MKPRTIIGLLLIVAGLWKLANMWGIIENDWLWSQPWTAYIAPADKKKFNHRVFPPKHAEFMPYFRYFTAPLRIGQKCKMSQNTSKCINQIVVKNRSK